jgi:hypothetical protein
MTRASGVSRYRQGADSASHAKLCNPFLPEEEQGRRDHGAEGQELRLREGS